MNMLCLTWIVYRIRHYWRGWDRLLLSGNLCILFLWMYQFWNPRAIRAAHLCTAYRDQLRGCRLAERLEEQENPRSECRTRRLLKLTTSTVDRQPSIYGDLYLGGRVCTLTIRERLRRKLSVCPRNSDTMLDWSWFCSFRLQQNESRWIIFRINLFTNWSVKVICMEKFGDYI